MNTQMPIATISYNTREFLIGVLKELQANKVIEDWFAMYHLAEDDEEKDHWHLFLIPASRVDTIDLRKHFAQIDPLFPSAPLGVIRFEKSQIDHACLYFAHYKPYLAWKHQSRKHHYDWNQFICSDRLWMNEVIHHALHFSEFAERSAILNAIRDCNNRFSDLIADGVIPLSQACHVSAYRQMCFDECLDRNGRHTQKHDTLEKEV